MRLWQCIFYTNLAVLVSISCRQVNKLMKTSFRFAAAAMLSLGLIAGGCGKKQVATLSTPADPAVAAQLKSFVQEKEAQADAAMKSSQHPVPPEFKTFFAAAQNGDWLAVSNEFEDFQKHAGQYEHSGKTDERLRGPAWEAVKETWGAFEGCFAGDEKYSAAFGNDIIKSIPPGSIYFGGTDPGRFLVTALQKSQVTGDPFFTLTQNALADGTYLDYLRGMYGDKIYIPTGEDSQRCFQQYTADVQLRSKENKLKPGEDVHIDPASGRIQISGQVAVMEINGLLVKTIFDRETNREFYVEESFPLDWMYPYLEPHGLIFKLNRQPAAKLSDETIRNDHDYWSKYVQPMIGDWLKDDTSVAEAAVFAEKTFLRQDFSGFKGDPRFIQNAYSHKMFSKLRSSIAGLYAWRVSHAVDPVDKEHMTREADFAFRQAWVLCPYSPEAVYRYVNFLLAQNRTADALVVAETAATMPEMQGADGEQIRSLVKQLQQFAQQSKVK
jgi:hypothetical protein